MQLYRMRLVAMTAALLSVLATRVDAQPAPFQVAPDTGLESGGETVLILGAGLSGTTSVVFREDLPAPSVEILADNLIRVTTPGLENLLPPNSTLPVSVTVTTDAGERAMPDAFVYNALPTFGNNTPPVIVLNPESLSMVSASGDTETVRVENVGAGTLAFEAAVEDGDDFLSVRVSETTALNEVLVTVDRNTADSPREGRVRFTGRNAQAEATPVFLEVSQEGAVGGGCFSVLPDPSAAYDCFEQVLVDEDGKGSLVPTTLIVSVWDDENRLGIEDATVDVTGAGYNALLQGSPNGLYQFSPLDPGTYDVSVRIPNRTTCVQAITLRDAGIAAMTVRVFPVEDTDGGAKRTAAAIGEHGLPIVLALVLLLLAGRRRNPVRPDSPSA